jgi:glycosyltransferase involved in cell wall biosynthesis
VRVLIDTTFAARAPYSGTAVYLAQLARALTALGGVELVEVGNARRRPPAGGGLASVRNLTGDLWWTEAGLARLAARHRPDVIHHPLPARSHLARVPQVVTVHDLAFERLPELFDRRYRAYASRAHRAAARAAAAVIAVSETTARDLGSWWGIPSGRIVVARHGPGQPLVVGGRAEPPAHFLYAGDAEPRKDLATLLRAHAAYRAAAERPLPLVLAGPAAGGPAAGGVRAEGPVTSARLAELHAGAAALVHPSLHEGFGLTLLEAMAAGTPVIAARSPGTEEVCGDAARYVPARDPAALTAALVELAGERQRRSELAQRGRRRAAEFSWEQSARAHLAAYSLAVARARRPAG